MCHCELGIGDWAVGSSKSNFSELKISDQPDSDPGDICNWTRGRDDTVSCDLHFIHFGFRAPLIQL